MSRPNPKAVDVGAVAVPVAAVVVSRLGYERTDLSSAALDGHARHGLGGLPLCTSGPSGT